MPPGLIGSVVPMMWTFELKPCVSAVKLNAERAADDFHLNAHATIVYTSKEPVCPRVELILKIIIILLIIFLGFIKSKPC